MSRITSSTTQNRISSAIVIDTYSSIEDAGEMEVAPVSLYLRDLVDHYNPTFSSVTRRSTMLAAVFNIISTLLDGTVLSLPFAFSKCGVGIGLLLLVAVAILTYFSLILITTMVSLDKYKNLYSQQK